MDKYGVEESSEKTAEPKDGNKCPDCGTPLLDLEQTGILICPKCGSKPFEERR